MVELRLDLLGGFSLSMSTGPLAGSLPTTKSKALLAWLVLSPGRPHRREELAALFWGERPDRAARHSLSQVLFCLRKTLSPAGRSPISADHRQVILTPGAIVSDVARFEALLAEGTDDTLAEAAALYRGELLAGFGAIGEVFDDWLEAERRRLRQGYRDCLARLLQRHETGPAEPAIGLARRLLELDPLDEEIHRRLIRLYLEQGRKADAIRQYAVCVGILSRELGVEPEAETTALYRSINPPDLSSAPMRPVPSLDGSRPRIVVLPIAANGLEIWQQEFPRDLTDALVVDLARFRCFSVSEHRREEVVGDNGGITVDRDGGADYRVEGRLRQARGAVGLSLRLVAAASGQVIWAERYAPQAPAWSTGLAAFTRHAVITLASRLDAAGIARALRRPEAAMSAYDCYMRGRYYLDRYDHASVRIGRQYMERAVAKDSSFADAWAHLGWFKAVSGWWEAELSRHLDEALDAARSATKIDPYDGHCRAILALIHLNRCDFRDAERCIEAALSLNPNLLFLPAYQAIVLNFISRPKEALPLALASVDEAPVTPNWLWEMLGIIFYDLRRFDEAQRAIKRLPRMNDWNRLQLAACHGQMGRHAKARAHWEKFAALPSRRDPESPLRELHESLHEHGFWLEGLMKAGLPVKRDLTASPSHYTAFRGPERRERPVLASVNAARRPR